ncbi:Cytoskeletal-regulatory complex EF hand family protein [Candida parapsilosis]|uniref:EH domain-containing protein n=2 Tax=Candida parapsilosis TaxID=5480 RepID=G8BFU1_CANPC|nr:uncharacterized protein CPAR2_203680 [Candida parapsilosis]KAF6055125.1 Cytoskeletal-regulatory complex EF hand family protein [Candida parapsilosis]KAF6055852.1 Cytoskeletal-regulatory complex EF hand family protein [Candida parapsilosis]KAF6058782.1 Cytoskeletal-regulatory complex EF hand family protein [Candida parapsilosis]KAF6067539.1 Cytoskeletal-regulatory complex EF hand family protein [Candida parapsilosis]KAI5901442.1 EH domain-containing and endocytosis protein 1 [Candida parapsi
MSTSHPTPTFKVGLTQEEKLLYTQIFKSLDPENTGIITGEKARTTFEKSNLPPAILGEIWQLADQNNLGFLNQFGFCYAMRLIGYTQAGHHPVPGLADTPGPLPKFVDLQLSQLQPQSTSNSYLSSQPNNAIPGSATPQESISPVSAPDYQKFSQLFAKTVGSVQGELSGVQAKDIFLKARLPTSTLGQIWSLVDRNNLGALHVGEFVIAMHLVQGVLSGRIKQLPPYLPDTVWKSVENGGAISSPPPQSPYGQSSRQASVSSQQTAIRHPPVDEVDGEWAITSVMKAQYDSIFNNLDKEHVGHLNPDQVASFLMTSKLDQQDLATIWDLADIQNTGLFTKLEFSIALFLVNRKTSGKNLPNVIPDSLITSIKSVGSKPSEAPPPARVKSAMDDLVDVFGSPSPQPAASPQPATSAQPAATLQQRVSSSDLSHSTKPRLTSTFKPTSSFGQSLMNQQQPKQEEEKKEGLVRGQSSPLTAHASPVPTSALPIPPQASSVPAQSSPQKHVNYDALRTVAPPPPPPAARSGVNSNNDLLADPEHSAQLSQATSDLANIGNQINSLRSNTKNLDEKKSKAEQELQKLLAAKAEFEDKLKSLKGSYDIEVKQYAEIEEQVGRVKDETEALRSEVSLLTATKNDLSNKLQSQQEQLQEKNHESQLLKEQISELNKGTTELQEQLGIASNEFEKLSSNVEVSRAQTQVLLSKNEELRSQITSREEENKRIVAELDREEKRRVEEEEKQRLLTKEHEDLKKTVVAVSRGATANIGVGAGVAAGAVSAVSAGVASESEKDKEDAVDEENDASATSPSALEGKGSGSSSFEMVEGRAAPEEFPSIKELDYQESESDEEPHFDDAVDNFKQPTQRGKEEAAFDEDIFNDLQPATEDVDENFNLEPAQVDNEDTTEFEKSDDANKDEWEQLFAGFGNS